MSSPRLERMKDAVRSLYDRNRQRGTAPWCGRDYDFVCPSMGTYPFQWFWDSCFHAEPEEHMARVVAQGDTRPMAGNAEAMDDLRRILDGRAVLYGQADATVDTAGRSVERCLRDLRKVIHP